MTRYLYHPWAITVHGWLLDFSLMWQPVGLPTS
jgi:hypothetical protein